MRTATWLTITVLLVGACTSNGAQGDGGRSDGGSGNLDGGPDMHNLSQLTVQGNVTLGAVGSPATGVTITAACGAKTTQVTTDDNGTYSLTADVKGCEPLVLQFVKESYMPNVRVIHLPPPNSPLTLDIPLSELTKLVCGDQVCTAFLATGTRIPATQIKQGWYNTLTGPSSLDFVPGEFYQADGKLIHFLGVSFDDFRDQDGKPIAQLSTPFDICTPITDPETLLWFGDVTPHVPNPEDGKDWAELVAYSFDPSTGRWAPRAEKAYLGYTAGNVKKGGGGDDACVDETDATGSPIPNIEPVLRESLPNIRASQFTFSDSCYPVATPVNQYWVCAKVKGSGWTAYGIPLNEKACFQLTAANQCGKTLSNVAVTMKGRERGFRVEAWTNPRGTACIEVVPSEPTGEDMDYNGLKGETVWVHATFTQALAGQKLLQSYETPIMARGQAQTCAHPEQCTPMKPTINDLQMCGSTP